MSEVSNIINVNNYLDFISDKIKDITIHEFELGGYNYNDLNKEVVIKKSTKRDDIETNIIRGKINRKCYEKIRCDEAKGKDMKQVQTVQEIDIDILTGAGIFNIVKDKSKLVEWKKLDLETKIKKLEEYITRNHENFSKEILDQLIDLIEKNKINFKKYIEYDSILEKILDMPIIEYDSIMSSYKLKYSSEKKTKKKKKISLK